MTNFVKIHCMTVEKLAEFLAKCDSSGEGIWWKWFDETRCKKCEAEAGDGDVPCEDLCECALYDDSPKAVILEWLESEYVEAASDEVKTKTFGI